MDHFGGESGMREAFDIDQARLAVRVGGIRAANVRAAYGNYFYVEFVTCAGEADLVTTRQRELRAFRDAGLALKALHEIGIFAAQVFMEDWEPSAGKPPAWARPDKSVALKETHERAHADVALEQKVKDALADAPAGADLLANASLVAVLKEKVGKIEADTFELQATIDAAIEKAGANLE
ncbi:hypothetical protein [Caballeronia sp. GAFFF1]|uniref:hypothetical protein n=1 Tax=Caballeronia sp. GAFFF1 TaxID=2921779 RepID=UPI002028DC39|nr:hypothetical protein [Caballeronia sp. GAFFF1]